MIHHPALLDGSRDPREVEDSENLSWDSWCKGHFGDKGLDERHVILEEPLEEIWGSSESTHGFC